MKSLDMFEIFISYATLLSYIAFSSDLFLQIKKIYTLKSSKDISSYGVVLRLLGSTIILIKFININDIYLIIGQIVFTLTVLTYAALVIRYKVLKN